MLLIFRKTALGTKSFSQLYLPPCQLQIWLVSNASDSLSNVFIKIQILLHIGSIFDRTCYHLSNKSNQFLHTFFCLILTGIFVNQKMITSGFLLAAAMASSRLHDPADSAATPKTTKMRMTSSFWVSLIPASLNL